MIAPIVVPLDNSCGKSTHNNRISESVSGSLNTCARVMFEEMPEISPDEPLKFDPSKSFNGLPSKGKVTGLLFLALLRYLPHI